MSKVQSFYITGFHLQNAANLAEQANRAHDSGNVQDEVRTSIGAYMFAAFSLEGAASEVCEYLLSKWASERVEKADTSLKWYLISTVVCSEPFDQGQEPLQTVLLLQKIRNRLVHPKPIQLGGDVIICHKDGSMEYNVPDDKVIQEDDTIYFGFGDLLKEFSAKKSSEVIKKAYKALSILRELTGYKGLDWLDGLPKSYPWVVK